MSDSDRHAQPRRPFLKFLFLLVLGVVVVGGVGAVVFIYMAHKDSAFLEKAVTSINKIADSLDDKEREASAGKLRELGEFLQDHSGDIDTYGEDVDAKLSEIREHSESAYQAAKKKVDEYRQGSSEEAEQE